MKPAVILLSGGVDSVTTLAVVKEMGFDIYALSFDYGQRHRIELNSAERCASAVGAKKHLIIRFDLREIGGSALTSDIEVPKDRIHDTGHMIQDKKIVQYESLPQTLSLIPVTYVPARNTIFLSIALAWAEVIGAEDIFIGANAIDYSGYPDCRAEFIRSFEVMANLATKAGVEGRMHFKIGAPLINLTKAEIIRKGIELGVDFSLTWSCYDPQPSMLLNFIPCGRCDSCLLRAKGFKEAGIEDPLILKVKHSLKSDNSLR